MWVTNYNSKHFLDTSYLHVCYGERYFVYISPLVPLKTPWNEYLYYLHYAHAREWHLNIRILCQSTGVQWRSQNSTRSQAKETEMYCLPCPLSGKTKQHKTKQNKTKQNKTKTNTLLHSISISWAPTLWHAAVPRQTRALFSWGDSLVGKNK